MIILPKLLSTSVEPVSNFLIPSSALYKPLFNLLEPSFNLLEPFFNVATPSSNLLAPSTNLLLELDKVLTLLVILSTLSNISRSFSSSNLEEKDEYIDGSLNFLVSNVITILFKLSSSLIFKLSDKPGVAIDTNTLFCPLLTTLPLVIVILLFSLFDIIDAVVTTKGVYNVSLLPFITTFLLLVFL